jgi:hypothetical protein
MRKHTKSLSLVAFLDNKTLSSLFRTFIISIKEEVDQNVSIYFCFCIQFVQSNSIYFYTVYQSDLQWQLYDLIFFCQHTIILLHYFCFSVSMFFCVFFVTFCSPVNIKNTACIDDHSEFLYFFIFSRKVENMSGRIQSFLLTIGG